MRCAVVGAGAWGTALADLFARNGHEVALWAREPEVVASINDVHENVHRFNEDEAVWRCFAKTQARRQRLLPLLVLLKSPPSLTAAHLPHLDWLAAEREQRPPACAGNGRSGLRRTASGVPTPRYEARA